jgi:lipopolysaccharide export system ATP-binding protein
MCLVLYPIMSPTSRLKAENIECHFGTKKILNNAYIQCNRGEIVGLLGRNGSGKSTLLKVLFGVIKCRDMYLSIDNERFNAGYRSGKIAYLSQSKWTPHTMRVGELLDYMRVPPDAPMRQIESIQDSLGQTLGSLSGGQRRFFETLSILYCPSPFILLDEPFSNLSPYLIEEIRVHIESLKQTKGFIITDHYYHQILELSDRIVLLHNGSNYAIHTSEDLATHGYIPYSHIES